MRLTTWLIEWLVDGLLDQMIDWWRLQLCSCLHQTSLWQCNPYTVTTCVIMIHTEQQYVCKEIFTLFRYYKRSLLRQQPGTMTMGHSPKRAVCLPERTWHGRLGVQPLEVSVWLCVRPAAWSVPSASLQKYILKPFFWYYTDSYKQDITAVTINEATKYLGNSFTKLVFWSPLAACQLLELTYVHL